MIYASTIPTIAQENNYTFRDYYDYKDHAIALAREIKQENYSDVYIMEEITDPCSLFDANFRNESERLGIKIITTTRYETTETDFKTDLLKMNPNKGDAMVLCSIRTEQFIMKQLKELGMIDVKTFHLTAPFLPAADTPELREIYEENDAISTWYGFGETSNTKMQSEFIDTYKEKYGQDPRPDAAYAYDDMHIIAIAISQCNSDVNNKDCVMQKMKSIKYFGVGGRLEFSDDRLSNREVSLIKVNEGKWQKIN
jgi:ABC-type branched-subunit amino acid transport system substrate-binding protein